MSNLTFAYVKLMLICILLYITVNKPRLLALNLQYAMLNLLPIKLQ